MNKKIKLIIKYQKTKNDEIFEEIISYFKRIMYCHLKMVPKFYQEDIVQEMLIVIYEYIIRYEIKPVHLLVENFNKENFIKLKENNFLNVNQIFNHPYLSAFFQKYGTNLFKRAFIQKDALNVFYMNMSCFVMNANFLDI